MREEHHLKKNVGIAKEAVEGLEEPLKTEAFKTILSKLLDGRQPKINKKSVTQLKSSEETNKTIPLVNRTKHPEIYNLNATLERALFILKIYKEEFNIDGLSPPQIAKILTETFRIKTSKQSISMALMKAHKETDKIKGSGNSFIYKIMNEGEKLLAKVIKNGT